MILGYGVLGTVLTAATALATLYMAQPIQPVIYDLFYLQVGPSEATETAILTHFLIAGVAGLTLTMLPGDYLSDRGTNRRTLAWVVAALLGLFLVFLVVALAGLAAWFAMR
jgi:type II secretory pathway component PulL